MFDAADLCAFYQTPVGQSALRLISQAVESFWPDLTGLRVLGFGYTPPYLSGALDRAERVIALMPSRMGVMAWPPEHPLSLLADEDCLPFADALFDRILVIHGIEGADSARILLRQLWRVLAPEGRLLVVAPNRASLWAQMVSSPFACGRPFHKGELTNLLTDTLFEPIRWEKALYMPPFSGRRLASLGSGLEKIGRTAIPALNGVHLVEATKSLYGRAAIKPAGGVKVRLRTAATLQS